MSTFGFKEWKLVCDAMERGEQSIILRKGGISEGKHGFQWLHQRYFLFPTYFHEQTNQLRLSWEPDPNELPTKDRETVEIRQFAEITETAEISDLEVARRLADFHVWNDEVVAERFDWGDGKGLSLAIVRVYQLGDPWVLQNRKGFGGCRSWLGLPEKEGLPESWELDLKPVLSDAEFAEQSAAIKEAM